MSVCNKIPHVYIIIVVVLCIVAQSGATSVLHGRVLYDKHGFHAGECVPAAYNSHSKRPDYYCDCIVYSKCYASFHDNSGLTYHSLCLARKNTLRDSTIESGTDYWCNKSNGFYLCRSYMKYPFAMNVIPLQKDFSPQLYIQ